VTTLLCGDALTVLATLPAASVQTCITSPPYWGLRDYVYLLLDTSTGATWVHRGELRDDRITFRPESFEPSSSVLRRFYPER
jgi:DNA modification methylase